LFRSGLTPAAMARIIESASPSILLDEIDRQIRKSKENAEALTQILNAGFDRRGAVITLMIQPPGGGEKEPRDFSVWAPQVLAGIGKSLHNTVRDRAITIAMQRRSKDQKVSRLRSKDGREFPALARKLARWAEDNAITLGATEVEMPNWLDDRAADGWEPLFAIARLAGDGWFNQVRVAARALSGSRDEIDADDDGLQLLSDIRGVLATKKSKILGKDEKGIPSKVLVRELVNLEESLWRVVGSSRTPLTQRGLADRLQPFGIGPQQLRLGGRGSQMFRGYRVAALDRVFAQYLPPPEAGAETLEIELECDEGGLPPSESVTPPHIEELSASQEISKCHTEIPCDGLKSAEKQGVEPMCGGVTDKMGGNAPSAYTNGEITYPPAEPPAKKPRKTFTQKVREVEAAHPDWDAARIANALGVPKSRVIKALT